MDSGGRVKSVRVGDTIKVLPKKKATAKKAAPKKETKKSNKRK